MLRIVCFPLKSRRSGRSGGCHAPAGGGGGPWTESPARPYTDRWTLPPFWPGACSCGTHTHTHTHKHTHTHTHTHTLNTHTVLAQTYTIHPLGNEVQGMFYLYEAVAFDNGHLLYRSDFCTPMKR